MKRSNQTSHRRLIRASEIGQYAYCARAWWLTQIKGYASSNQQTLAQGTWAHETLGRQIFLSVIARRIAFGLIIVAALLLILSRFGIL
jgi:hypothetical protein